ncbi:Pkinase-domain-containing protein [Testicularia cyperi]|uniref:Pkinase-domain-containing protein n=1 Tax=Testicularia cyperi TaxID=1882483 RepID=A0A317XKC7_9BASI|nr:Pkinase-domain-containing protein [Testicularia cyperi]
MASLIPPKQPRKPGMPKLTIPARPSSSSSSAPDHQRSLRPQNDPRRPQKPSLVIPITNTTANTATATATATTTTTTNINTSSSSSSSSSSNLDHYSHDDGFEDGLAGALNSTASTIYPDTVPHMTNAQMHSALTDDLRRAIGGMTIHDTDAERLVDANGFRIPAMGGNRASSGYHSHASSSRASSGTHARQVALDPNNSSRRSNDTHPSNTPSHPSTVADPIPTASTASTSSSAPTGSGASNTGTSSGNAEDDGLSLPGNIEIVSRLGEGASGEVHKVLHRPTGLIMAKKTISTSPNPSIHRQILRELAFNRSCHSDYIVRYYGAFLEDHDTSISICMEYAEAGSLDAIYKKVKSRNGRTGEKVLGKVAECVLKGLGYLHERKIIHRDIKPSNIVVTRQGQIKLCDFGVSGELINSVAGTFTGTSYYMAPERIKGLAYSITSDVWSLGLTILEVASNRFPFPAEGEPPLGPIDLLSYVVSMKVPELQDDDKAGIKWSRALRDFIERCLEKEPAKRPGPHKMTGHPFIRKSETRQPQPDIAKFVADVWGWSYLPSTIEQQQQQQTPTQANASALSRMPSVRSAPIAMPSALSTGAAPALPPPTRQPPATAANVDVPQITAHLAPSPSPSSSAVSPSASHARLRELPKIAMPNTHATDAGMSDTSAVLPAVAVEHETSRHRSQEERLAARMREADVGLIGSPTQTDDEEDTRPPPA